MHLLRYRPRVETRWLVLPRGERRRVKVTVNDQATIQQVEDSDVLHGTARPEAYHLDLRGTPSSLAEFAARRRHDRRNRRYVARRQAFVERPGGLWAPLPEGELEA